MFGNDMERFRKIPSRPRRAAAVAAATKFNDLQHIVLDTFSSFGRLSPAWLRPTQLLAATAVAAYLATGPTPFPTGRTSPLTLICTYVSFTFPAGRPARRGPVPWPRLNVGS